MTVTVEKPKIITLLYRQEKSDSDYGSCLWARFYLDTQNYTMSIESDCGNYSYGWYPTPDSEPFLHLLCRLDSGYLLHKLAERTTIDGDATWSVLEDLVKNTAECEEVDLDNHEWQNLRDVCYHSYDVHDFHSGVTNSLRYTTLDDKIGEFEIYECIQMDYDCSVKKIVSVFLTAIVPVLKEMEESE